MIACLPPPPPSAYRLVEELRDPAAIAGVHRVAMDELESEQALLTKLGARGWGRIHHFRNHYHQPWGERNAAPLSPRALEGLTRFVVAAAFAPGKLPSVFLTDSGGLELCWEDERGGARQVEFKSDGIDYYIADCEEEGSVRLDNVGELVRKFAA
ncbi:MAG: hypothetical protein HY736_21405 [Verrucomicrobia bacterium]|nr:hypothetical protein [Verrucomicrobiota bacterium]